jgi:hypothetical protein
MIGSAKTEERIGPGISWLLVGYAGLVAGAIYFLCIG